MKSFAKNHFLVKYLIYLTLLTLYTLRDSYFFFANAEKVAFSIGICENSHIFVRR